MEAELNITDIFAGPDLLGKRFGRWTVTAWAGLSAAGEQPYWKCKCECGESKNVYAYSLLRGKSTSCGCLMKEVNSTHGQSRGLKQHPLYRRWIGFRQRCNNPKHPKYEYYGGIGITYDPRWENFEIFLSDVEDAWEEASKKEPDLSLITIDRIDNDKGYYKHNVRFISHKEQMNNTSRTPKYYSPSRNESHTCSEWAEITGILYVTLNYRLKKWPVDLALNPDKNVAYAGKQLT